MIPSKHDIVERVIDLCDGIDRMWKDDSTQDEVQEKSDELRRWIADPGNIENFVMEYLDQHYPEAQLNG